MPNPPVQYRDRYESADGIHSVTVDYDAPVSGNIPVLRFPAAGRVLGAWLVSRYSSAGTNVLLVGLKNGGNVLGGIGTIVIAATNNGTVIAGSAYQLPVVTNGPEAFAQGDWAVLNVAGAMQPNTSFTVTIDYRLDAF